MYNFTKLFCIIFALIFLIVSCKNNDEEIAPKNIITYNGIEYELANGFLRYYGQFSKDEGHTQVLFLYSPGITVHETAGKIDSASGKGHLIAFEIFSAVPESLGDGEYTFDFNNTYKEKTFDQGFALLNADYLTGDGTKYEIIGGKLTVKKDKDNYVISFDCIESEGKTLTGFYKGPLAYYDER